MNDIYNAMTWAWWLGGIIAVLAVVAVVAVLYPWQTDPLNLQRWL